MAKKLTGGSASMKHKGEKPMLLRLSPHEHAAVMRAAAVAAEKPLPGSVWARSVVVAAAERILKKFRNGA